MTQSPFNLDGQVVLVSGAGRGIGRAAAELIARMGARVAITSRTVAQVEEVAQAIRDEGGQAWAFRADVAAIEDHESLLDDVEDTIGPLTGLVNVAGISPILQRGERITAEDYDHIQNINQRGTFFLTRNFAARLIDA
ncbi:MAG: SDR family NAD(P)-dependent oxidoreductase, partial [Chloroflexi bacterium]|nr:SDR family NAD(P)-dependent oxidoreductase [Chloroflexota bacterium]